jgi:ATP-dependent Clp protease ATP-binding subunit ClpC
MKIRAIPTLFRLCTSGHTDGVVNSVSAAWDLAASRGHASISPEHLLAGIIKTGERRPHTVLRRMGFQLDAKGVSDLSGPPQLGKPFGWLHFDEATLDLLSAARGQARGMGHSYVGTEHVLLALLLGPTRPASNYLREQQVKMVKS